MSEPAWKKRIPLCLCVGVCVREGKISMCMRAIIGGELKVMHNNNVIPAPALFVCLSNCVRSSRVSDLGGIFGSN